MVQVFSWAAENFSHEPGPWYLPYILFNPLFFFFSFFISFLVVTFLDFSCQRFLVLVSHNPFLPPSLPLPTATITQATLAGTLTGPTETLFHTPFELLKVRLQITKSSHSPPSLPPSFPPSTHSHHHTSHTRRHAHRPNRNPLSHSV